MLIKCLAFPLWTYCCHFESYQGTGLEIGLLSNCRKGLGCSCLSSLKMLKRRWVEINKHSGTDICCRRKKWKQMKCYISRNIPQLPQNQLFHCWDFLLIPYLYIFYFLYFKTIDSNPRVFSHIKLRSVLASFGLHLVLSLFLLLLVLPLVVLRVKQCSFPVQMLPLAKEE